jgi:hypothetical protein
LSHKDIQQGSWSILVTLLIRVIKAFLPSSLPTKHKQTHPHSWK